MIYEFADITAKKDQSTQESVRSFLEFAPVLDHSGNKPVEIDTAHVLNMMSKTGGYAERFGSSVMLNWALSDSVAGAFRGIDPDKNVKADDLISDNGLVKGKNYYENKKAATNTTPDEELKAQREFRQRVITMMRRLPTYLFLEEQKIDNIRDILYNNNQELFLDTVGINLDNFKDLCTGFIKVDRLDRAIMAYNQIEAMP
jgi:hypothetical protein